MSDATTRARARVAYLALGTFYGGATASLALMTRAIDSTRFAKHLFLASSHPGEMLDELSRTCDSVEVVPVGSLHHNQVEVSTRGRLERLIRASEGPSRELVRRLRRLEIDILHVSTAVFPHVLRRVREGAPSVKIVTHVREMLPARSDEVSAYLVGEILKHSDAIVTISDNELPPYRSHANVRVVPNPFDFSELDRPPGDLRERHAIPRDRLLVGMLAQLHRAKGHLDFLRALRLVLASGAARERSFAFVVVGYAPTPWWKRIAKLLLGREDFPTLFARESAAEDVAPHLLVLPYTYRVLDVLAALDVVVRPSLAGDPWGRDIIEAMAFGKPVVATGTSQFYVVEGETGFLVPPGAPDALAEKIGALVRDAPLRARLGAAGCARIRELCDHRKHGERIMAIYDELLARSGSR